jgi:hypothetical protein
MTPQDMTDLIWCAMDNRRDMDTSLTDYAKAATEAVGWREVTKEMPDINDVVVCTNGKARWLDKRIVGCDELKWQEHVATHWHPLLDLPPILSKDQPDTRTDHAAQK